MARPWSTTLTPSYSRARAPRLPGVVTKLTLDVVPYFEVSASATTTYFETAIESLPDVFQDCDPIDLTSGFGTGPAPASLG